jgi:hypothetical protein
LRQYWNPGGKYSYSDQSFVITWAVSIFKAFPMLRKKQWTKNLKTSVGVSVTKNL